MKNLVFKKGLWLIATIAAEYVLLRLLQKQESAEMNDAKKANEKKSSAVNDLKAPRSHRPRKSKKAASRNSEAHH